jgi:CRISPR-associated protein Csm2
MNISTEHYVDQAEEVIRSLKGKKNMVTTSKLRNLLAMTADIYNEVVGQSDEKLSPEICARIEYLRVRFLYEAGRDNTVRDLVDEADIITLLRQINGKRSNYILFNRYMEALVAFHRYYGGKEY